MALTKEQARGKVLEILAMLQADWGLERWLSRFDAEEQEEIIEAMIEILLSKD